MFAKNRYSLLIHYIFIYPLYYVVAMSVATAILAPLMGWTFEGAKRFFLIVVIVMWLASYLIHFNILLNAISELRYGKHDKVNKAIVKERKKKSESR